MRLHYLKNKVPSGAISGRTRAISIARELRTQLSSSLGLASLRVWQTATEQQPVNALLTFNATVGFLRDRFLQ